MIQHLYPRCGLALQVFANDLCILRVQTFQPQRRFIQNPLLRRVERFPASRLTRTMTSAL
jgi:hypothetical protein